MMKTITTLFCALFLFSFGAFAQSESGTEQQQTKEAEKTETLRTLTTAQAPAKSVKEMKEPSCEGKKKKGKSCCSKGKASMQESEGKKHDSAMAAADGKEGKACCSGKEKKACCSSKGKSKKDCSGNKNKSEEEK